MKANTSTNELFAIADGAMQAFLQTDTFNSMSTDRYEEASEYFYELVETLKKAGLTEDQKKLLRLIVEVHTDCIATYSDMSVLYGMQVQSALQEMIRNPIEVLNFYNSKAIPVRELYK